MFEFIIFLLLDWLHIKIKEPYNLHIDLLNNTMKKRNEGMNDHKIWL